MRIGFLIDRWQPARGGAETALAAFAAHLEGRGHQVLAFACQGPGPGETAPGELHLVPAPLGLTRGRREQRLGTRLVERAAAADCDLTIGVRHLPAVDLYWPHGGSHLATLEATRRARGRNPEAPPRGRHRTFVALEEQLLARGGARRTVAVSPLVARELGRLWPACRNTLVTVPNGLDLTRFSPGHRAEEAAALRRELALPQDTHLFAFVARNPLLKGLPPLLAALARLDHPRWHLLVLGFRRTAAWRRLARRLGLPPERISWRDHLPAERFTAADALVMPTWREPCGLALMEALAAGTPILTTALAGAADLVKEPTAGLVIPSPADLDALTAGLGELVLRPPPGEAERDHIRRCVAHLDAPTWLEAMERELMSLA